MPGGPPAANYVAEYYDGSATPEGAQAVAVTAGQVRTGIDATMVPGASISGRVTDSATPPSNASNICVSAASTTGASGGSATTSAAGTYTITGLPPATYRVHFMPCVGSSSTLLAEYYNDAATIDESDPFSLAIGESRTGVDAALATGATISGHVTDSGTPANNLANVCVTAEAIDAGLSDGTATTNASGNYSIGGLRPGAYKVHFAPCYSPFTPYPNVVAEYYDGASSFESAQTVNLTPGQTRNDIGASMQPGATIFGHVDDSEGDDAEFVCVDAQPTGLSEPDGVDPFGPGFAATNASGNYTITGLKAGDYKLRLSDCSPFGVLDFDTEWWNNKASYAAADTVERDRRRQLDRQGRGRR